MAKGTWIYNWLKKCYEWIENGKVYPSPNDVPKPEAKRPYVDPGRKIKSN